MERLPEARDARNVLILTGVGHFSTHFFELMFPTLAVALASQTRLPLNEVLGWSFLGYLLFGLGALPAGLLADRIGSRQLLVAAMFGLGVAALAASEAPNGRALSFCLAAMGACASIYHPVGMSLIAHGVAARGRALGINGVFGNAAIALTPVITATLCAQVGWQSTYRLVGYVMCALAVGCAFLRIDERPHSPTADAPAPPQRPQSALPLRCCSSPPHWPGSATAATPWCSRRTSPRMYRRSVSERRTSLAYLFGIAGQYIGGLLADRHDLRRLYLAFHALSLPALLLMTALSGFPLIGTAAVFVFFSLGMQPIENTLFYHCAPPRWRATAYGLKFVLTFGVGSLAVWMVRWADAAGELSYAILCLAGVVAAVVGAAAVLVRLGERRTGDAVPDAAVDLRRHVGVP